ncbi:MAG: class I SAM-dependent methyltransferase [Pseudomonadales bacterium]
MASDLAQRIFREVHTDLPREAPGNRASTARALSAATELPDAPTVLDIGCGPGTQTLDLAALLPGARITAIDALQRFIDVAQARLRAAGLAQRVTATVGDMRTLAFPDGSFDLLWCEGAVYVMGVREALTAWRPLLKPRGYIGFTEAVWLTDSPPEEIAEWWAGEYPQMVGVDACLTCVQECDFELVDHFVLPEAAWWDDYYRPLERRLNALRDRYRDDPAALEAIGEHQREVDCYRRWSDCYGYLFVVARRPREG